MLVQAQSMIILQVNNVTLTTSKLGTFKYFKNSNIIQYYYSGLVMIHEL
jgi:hypothetical protein